MDVETNQPRPEISGKSKVVKTVANMLVVVIGISTGAAIVHGMVYQQCVVKKVSFIAGVLPPGMLSEQETGSGSFDIQNCFDGTGNRETQQEVDGFEAGVLPPEEPVSTESQSSVQGATPIVTNTVETATPPQTSAPAPAPQQATAPTKPQEAPAQPLKKEPANPKPATAKTTPPKATPAKTTVKTTTQKQSTAKVKPVTVNLDKLSLAVAMQETHNCKDTRGSALLNNCHGFRKNGKFMSFSTQAESHAYFKQLWARSYGGGFPTYRLAQIYSGNDRPDNWLKNVTYYYNKL